MLIMHDRIGLCSPKQLAAGAVLIQGYYPDLSLQQLRFRHVTCLGRDDHVNARGVNVHIVLRESSGPYYPILQIPEPAIKCSRELYQDLTCHGYHSASREELLCSCGNGTRWLSRHGCCSSGLGFSPTSGFAKRLPHCCCSMKEIGMRLKRADGNLVVSRSNDSIS
jgi:hypothetical protein